MYLRPALPIETPQADWELRRKGDVWQWVDETVSACGSEAYPWDPAVVKAIRLFEPDFCPLWIQTVYRSPAGSYKVFGRHAIGIDCRSHVQEGGHRNLARVLTTCYGLNAGRRPIIVDSILQNEAEQIIPDLKVYGYRPMDWAFYYDARRKHYEEKKKREAYANDPEAEKEAKDYIEARQAATEKEKASVESEADYVFDHETNRGQKVKEAFQGMTSEDWRSIGVR